MIERGPYALAITGNPYNYLLVARGEEGTTITT